VPIHYLDTPDLAIEMSAAQSTTTHLAPECLGACRLLAEVLVRALQGKSKNEVLAPSRQTGPMSGALQSIAQVDYKTKAEDQIKGSGYVVQSLEAALWCFWQTDSFEACVLRAANLGDDADTTAAVAGQVAGAFYGEFGIPAKWLGKLAMAGDISKWAEQLVLQKPK
jgi:ADP-ribosyl-[dinitrogen reductase] hydrolase